MCAELTPSLLLVSPTPTGTNGNAVTASRWAGILRELGHRVQVSQSYQPGDHLALVALHARKSADAVRAFRAEHPQAPVVIALTGTDLYPDLVSTGVDLQVLALASKLVVLQPDGLNQLEPGLRERAVVIFQSMPAIPAAPARADCFEVAFLAHLRPVKDPLCLAAAVRQLPATSRVRVTHVGGAHDESIAAAATAEMASNPRYCWLGPLPREAALGVLARSRLLALTSWHEGGANVVSEALAADVPVVSSRIPGSVGMLGPDYPGYYPAGDAGALADALAAAEQDRDGYYRRLRSCCASLRTLIDPARELRAWQHLLTDMNVMSTS